MLHLNLSVLLLLFSALAIAGPLMPPVPMDLPVRAYVLVDYQTGRVLAGKNEQARLPPASLTKIMTVYTAGTYLHAGLADMQDLINVSETAWRMEGSRMFIEPRLPVSLEQLLFGVIVQSGNDASVALSEHLAGSEAAFVQEMNHQAEFLQLPDTHFMNSTGLPQAEHFSSALDLAEISRHLIREYPDLYGMHALPEYTYNEIHQLNRNRLLVQDERVDGIKTGYTREAGYSLVSSARSQGMRLIAVVLGADSEAERLRCSRILLDYGFRHFVTEKIASADQEITRVRVWGGHIRELSLGLEEDIYLTHVRGSEVQLLPQLPYALLQAPVALGQNIGTLRIETQGQSQTYPLFARRAISSGSLLSRMSDSIRLWFE